MTTTQNSSLYSPQDRIFFDASTRFNKDLTWGEKAFLAEIKSMCGLGTCYYHQMKMAEMFGVSTVTINTWVKRLCYLGLIEIQMNLNDENCKAHIKLKS